MCTTSKEKSWLAASCVVLVPTLLLHSACLPTNQQVQRSSRATMSRALGIAAPLVNTHGAQQSEITAALLAKPLTQDAVVRLALANSPRFRVAVAELDIAVADIGIALAPPAVHVDVAAHRVAGKYEFETEALIDVMALLNRAVHATFRTAQRYAAEANAVARAVDIATDAEIAYLQVAKALAEQALRQDVYEAADAAVALRERMHASGNTTDLAYARQLDQREQARIELGRAQVATERARETLNAQLGLTGAQTSWTLADSLPPLPVTAPQLDQLETTAVAANLELTALRHEQVAMAELVGIARKRAWLPELAAGISVTTHDGSVVTGPALQLSLPWLGPAGAVAARREAELRRTQQRSQGAAVATRAAARAARIAALGAYAEARHWQDVIVPLRKRIVEETLLHYNAMNADPFTLIMAQREWTEARRQLVDATMRFAHAMAVVRAMQRGVVRAEALQGQPSAGADSRASGVDAQGHD